MSYTTTMGVAAGRTAHLLTLVALLLCCAATAGAQSKTTDRGFQPGGSYAIGDIETINTTNGNLMFRLPLAKLPAGRGGLSAGINLLYNSKIYESYNQNIPDGYGGTHPATYLRASEDGGWRYGISYQLRTIFKYMDSEPPQCSDPAALFVYKTQLIFPDGGTHEFRPQGFRDDEFDDGWFGVEAGGGQPCGAPPVTSTISFFSIDGSYLRLDVSYDPNPSDGIDPTWTLYFPDGGRVTGGGTAPQRIYDRNNNYVEIQNATYNNHPATKLLDQLGRYVIIEYGSAANQDSIHAWGFNNEHMQSDVKWKTISVQKTYGTDGPSTANNSNDLFSFYVVDQVLLPVQAGSPRLAYTFNYNPGPTAPFFGWGEVSSVTLPSGAQAAYQWKQDGSSNSNPPRWEDVLKDRPTRKDLTYQQEYDGTSTPVTDTWQYAINDLDCQITAPDGGVTREYWYGGSSGVSADSWREKLVYKTENPDGSVTEQLWKTNTPYIFYSGSYGPKYFNPFVKTEFTSIRNAAGALVKTVIKDYKYNKNGNVTEVKDYDWVDYGSVPRDAQGHPTGVPAGAPLKRVTTNTYYNPTPDSSDIVTDDPDEYHKATSSRVCNALESSEVGNGAQTLSRAENYYDSPSTTANVTEQRRWDSYKGGASRPLTRPLGFGGADNYISTSQQYDAYGNQTLLTDANGNQTQITYGLVNGFTGLYPTVIEVAFGSLVEHTSTTEYDFYTGAVTRTTDVDNNVSASTTYDVFGRPTLVKSAEGTAEEMRTYTVYSDVGRRVTSRADMNTLGDGKQVTIQYYDQLGRLRLSQELEDSLAQSEDDETAGIKIQTRYKFSGTNSYLLVSNPYRAARAVDAGGEVTMGWTETISDQGGRVVRAETFGGAGLPAPWGNNTSTTGAATTSYDAEATTATDQAGRQRKSVSDGSGMVVQVFEEPNDAGYNYQTSYTYDALGNITQVTQGTQTRTSVYSSLSRLISATNPEVCQQQQMQCVPVPVTYDYDSNGNIKKKTDARGTQANYSYDALNRITALSYAGGTAGATPSLAYFYDSQQLPPNAPVFDRGLSVGKLVAVTYGGGVLGSYTGGYDAQGRVRLSRQVTDTGTAGGVKTYAMAYDYYRDGRPKTETYPSGKVIETKYDATGKIAGVKNQGGLYYAGGDPGTPNNPEVIKYTAHGAAERLKLGNNLWEHLNYNSRLQPVQLGLGTSGGDSSLLQLDNSYGTTDNNGNVRTQTITVPGMASALRQDYSYDRLNRITLAQETKVSSGVETWKQAYTYKDQNGQNEQFGNRRVDTSIDPLTNQPRTTANVTPQLIPQIDAADNRFSNGQGYSYDSAGNLTAAPTRSHLPVRRPRPDDEFGRRDDGHCGGQLLLRRERKPHKESRASEYYGICLRRGGAFGGRVF
jgi:hypothetical protein